MTERAPAAACGRRHRPASPSSTCTGACSRRCRRRHRRAPRADRCAPVRGSRGATSLRTPPPGVLGSCPPRRPAHDAQSPWTGMPSRWAVKDGPEVRLGSADATSQPRPAPRLAVLAPPRARRLAYIDVRVPLRPSPDDRAGQPGERTLLLVGFVSATVPHDSAQVDRVGRPRDRRARVFSGPP